MTDEPCEHRGNGAGWMGTIKTCYYCHKEIVFWVREGDYGEVNHGWSEMYRIVEWP